VYLARTISSNACVLLLLLGNLCLSVGSEKREACYVLLLPVDQSTIELQSYVLFVTVPYAS